MSFTVGELKEYLEGLDDSVKICVESLNGVVIDADIEYLEDVYYMKAGEIQSEESENERGYPLKMVPVLLIR